MRSSEQRSGEGESRWLALASLLAIAAVGAFALNQSWEGWLHPIIDAGRDLYIPEQLRSGTKLYRDIAYFYPPLAPYALAMITSLAGSSLHSYALTGIVLAALVASTMFGIARTHSGELAAFSAGLLFVSVCMVGSSAYGSNFLFPYSHNAVFGMALFLLFEWAMVASFVNGATRGRITAAMVSGALCSLTKIEFIAFVLATIAVGGVLAWVTRQARPGAVVRTSLVLLSGVLAAWAATWLFFLDAGGLFFANVIPPSLLSGSVAKAFYAKVSGTDRLGYNLTLALAGGLAVCVHVILLRMLDAASRRERRSARIAATGLALVLISGAAWFLGSDLFFRGWTLIQVCLVPFAVRDLALLRREPARTRLAVMPLLLWFSACGTSRIWLNLAPVWYGFFLMLPVILLIVHVLFRYLPDKGVYTRRAAAMWIPLLLVIAGRNLMEQRVAYEGKPFAIESSRGTIRDYSAERASVLNEFLGYAESARLEELVMIPEGLTVNYLASVRNPTRYHTFTPAEMPTRESERPIVEELARVRPHHIAITTQEAAAFGDLHFGRDYGTEILRFVREHYELEKEWRTSTFSLFLLRRVE